jgi:hypothetical protein
VFLRYFAKVVRSCNQENRQSSNVFSVLWQTVYVVVGSNSKGFVVQGHGMMYSRWLSAFTSLALLSGISSLQVKRFLTNYFVAT